MNKEIFRKSSVINAICIGSLCSMAYLAVYFARNILGAVTPQMIKNCRQFGVKPDREWFEDVKNYEINVLKERQ